MIRKFVLLIMSFCTIFTASKIKDYKIDSVSKDTSLPVIFEPTSSESYKSSVLVEITTLKVLSEEHKDIRLPMASMTKVMSLILFFEGLDEGRINLDQKLTCSKYASSMGGSQIFLEQNEQMSVDDLLKSVCIASANDATVVLAEAIAGSEALFVKRMNDKALELGLKNTYFSNSTGLPTNDKHYTSAYDMAVMGSYLINNYPKALEYSSRYEDYVRVGTPKQFWLVNTNKLVKKVDGIDGLKTGWTENAGYCLTCTKYQDGMRLISVVMGADTVDNRTNKTLELFNYGFSNYKYQEILPKETIVKVNENILLSPTKQTIVLSEPFGVVIPVDNKIESYQTKLEIDYDKINNFETENIGTASFYKDGELIGTVNLKIKETTSKMTLLQLFNEVLKSIFTNI